jgi:DNA polymerase III subunit delta'
MTGDHRMARLPGLPTVMAVSLFDADEFLVAPAPPVDPAPEVEPLPLFPDDVAAEEEVALAEATKADPEDELAVVDEALIVEPVAEPVGEPLGEPLGVEETVTEEDISEQSIALETETPVRVPSVDAIWSGIRYQDEAVSALRAAERAPVHAYLLLGPTGAGTRQAAGSFATALLCPFGGCGVCSSCVRAMAQTHPDLVVVEREGASISVDQAREIIRLALRSPVEGNRKVLVLVDFHLVLQAGPTLLKIIEEPPASTVFVVLAEHLPPELVTIASRCVTIEFRGLRDADIISALIDEGASQDRASKAALASAGNLDRARLLVSDESLGQRVEFWQSVPRRLDGTGAAAAALSAEAVGMLDAAAVGPLEARHAAELKAFEARLEQTGQTRGAAGQRKELQDRHKRELKRLRDDELRLGLALLQRGQRDLMLGDPGAAYRAGVAIDAISRAAEHLERNPSVPLLLQALLLKIGARTPSR